MVEHPAVNGRVAGSSPAPGDDLFLYVLAARPFLQKCDCFLAQKFLMMGLGGALQNTTTNREDLMKKLFALSLVATLAPSLALAAGNHPMAGCGLGYLLMSNKDNTKVTQVVGATTNGTFGSQTFGISSGTSGCTEDGAVKFAKAAEVFAEVNLDSLRREMAIGKGEYVETFASLLGASEVTRPAVLKLFQSEYASLFPTSSTTSAELMSHLSETFAQSQLVG
jgi:hypothetical protein